MANLALVSAALWATVIAMRWDEVCDLSHHQTNLSNDDLGRAGDEKRDTDGGYVGGSTDSSWGAA
jgi:hypothetical protein